VWLRRDLRLDDNAALWGACAASDAVIAVFVLDPALLRGDRVGPPIVAFFFDALAALRTDLRAIGSDLALLEGEAAQVLPRFAWRLDAQGVFYNEDYEPPALVRDAAVTRALHAAGVASHASLDHVYYGADDILKDDGTPYTVFTPYKRSWRARRDEEGKLPFASASEARKRLLRADDIGVTRDVPAPEDYGHTTSQHNLAAGERVAKRIFTTFLRDRIEAYETGRNVPAIDGTSVLSPHLRAGTIGIRRCVEAASAAGAGIGPRTWVDELIWRDFYQQILRNFPRVATEPFRAAGASIEWRDDEAGWRAWTEGETGYPIVDAAMRQLNSTGWMHNRLRMIAASFLTKHLLIDYRRGERYFEQHLADADLAANNGGWQWSASTGTDAVPYFRFFNPVLQGKRFDPTGEFVRRMIPQLAHVPDAYLHEPWTMPPLIAAEARCVAGRDYPAPIVDHVAARERALAVFGSAFSPSSVRRL
jgi:deoxyribodipyrimidine photo-lyase